MGTAGAGPAGTAGAGPAGSVAAESSGPIAAAPAAGESAGPETATSARPAGAASGRPAPAEPTGPAGTEPARPAAAESGRPAPAEPTGPTGAEPARPAAAESGRPAPAEPSGPAGGASDATAESGGPADGAEDSGRPALGELVSPTGRDADLSPADRPSRHRSPVLVAAMAAAVLLVGGGGAYLAGAAGDGGSGAGASGGDGTPPPLALDGYAEGSGNGIAPGEPDPNGVTYQASGDLPKGPGSAPVYWAKGEVGREEVARLAAALGVDGTPVAEGQAWKVGSGKDGQGPSLQVNRQAPGTWTFHRYAPGTDDCQSVTVCSKPPTSAAGDPVSEAAARKAAAPVLRVLGQDATRADASQVMGAQRVVNADPVVGGLPTYGWPTGLTVSAQGEVVAGSGQLKAPVKGHTYPVLDARATLDRLNAAQEPGHRVGIGGCATPVPLEEDRAQAPCEPSGPTAAPGEPAVPADPTLSREAIVVEDAVFGLASHFVDARPTLVPSWLFEVRAPGAKEGFTVTYPAVDPRYLTSPAPSGSPSGNPSPRPTGPDAPAESRNVKVEGYTTEGRELTVAFTGGVCADYEAAVTEGADEVTVTVTETPWPDKVCIMIAKTHHRTVELDEPLGKRKVVGSDGEAIPLEKPGARLP
ncbi:hypothetical protein AB0K93_12450 [Streptomyces sp. NPDC052676]|uniref:hypothetical protein n=1 Tax=Streptomyces sp. NPDC052676 TaxID=3154953 RepID=UPI003431E258